MHASNGLVRVSLIFHMELKGPQKVANDWDRAGGCGSHDVLFLWGKVVVWTVDCGGVECVRLLLLVSR
jgi:hypothetical protein